MTNPVTTVDELLTTFDPERVALVDDDGEITYGELEDLVARTAGGLVARIGTGESRIMILARTERDGVIGLLAAHRAGFSASFIAPRQTAHEHRAWIELAQPGAILVGRTSVDAVDALGELNAPDGRRASRRRTSRTATGD